MRQEILRYIEALTKCNLMDSVSLPPPLGCECDLSYRIKAP